MAKRSAASTWVNRVLAPIPGHTKTKRLIKALVKAFTGHGASRPSASGKGGSG